MRRIAPTRDSRVIIELGDEWVRLMECEAFRDAYEFTDHDNNGWSPEALDQAIKEYDDGLPTQRVTLNGRSTDVSQTKNVTWWERNDYDCVGELWYDLYIDGVLTDLTATFSIMERDGIMWLRLNDVHVM